MDETKDISAVKTCKAHIKGDTEEMTDVAPFSNLTDATSTAGNNSAKQTVTPSHGVEQGHNHTNLQSSGSNLELSRMFVGKQSKLQDADKTTLNMQTKLPTERLGTNIGCVHVETTQDRHTALGLKREHSYSPLEQSSPISPTHLPITCTCTCTAAGCLVEPGENLVTDGEVLHHGHKEERQPRKRLKFDSETAEVGEANGQTKHPMNTLPPTIPAVQDQSTSYQDPGSEVTAAPSPPTSPRPVAITRSIPLTPRRPTSLLVSELQPSLPQEVVAPHAQAGGGGGDDSDMFPIGREEETPNGGVGELVAPSLHSPRQNNGEIVTPHKKLTLHNTVFGHLFCPEPYRRQLSDNNAHYHTVARIQARIRRQNSEPTTELYRGCYDNNGRLITEQ